MVGYDSNFRRDCENEGWTLSVYMHWDDSENPPENRKEAIRRLRNTIKGIEPIVEELR